MRQLNGCLATGGRPRGGTGGCCLVPRENLMKIVPVGDRIVVKRLETREQSAGGILLPENAREKPQQGRVLAVGPGRLLPCGSRATLQVNEGDQVVFASYSGHDIEVDGCEVLIMSEADVLAVM
jgi:chaperonin GroES